MVKTIESDRLGRLGESEFETLCIRADLIPNQVSWDRTGWDYVVEFPHPSSSRHSSLDTRPNPPEAKFQVKAVGERSKSIKLRLSTAERLAKYPGPSFICVLTIDGARRVQSIHILHILNDLLAFFLKELRQCEYKDSTKINKTFTLIPFEKWSKPISSSEKEFRRAIEVACGVDSHAYALEKQQQVSKLGYDTAKYVGSFSLEMNDLSEMTDVFFGLKSGQIRDFIASEVRFGISRPLPIGSGEGTINFSPSPRKGDFSIAAGLEKLNLKVDVFFNLFVKAGRLLRLTYGCVEIKVNMDLNIINFSADTSQSGMTVEQHLKLNRLQRIALKGGKVQISVEGRRLLAGQFKFETTDVTDEQLKANKIVLEALHNVIYQADASDINVTTEQINQQLPRIMLLNKMLSGVDFKTSFSLNVIAMSDDAPPQGIYGVLFLLYLRFGNTCFGVAAVGTANLTGIGTERIVALSNLQAREIETVRGDQESMDEFRKDMQAQTGLSLVVDLGA